MGQKKFSSFPLNEKFSGISGLSGLIGLVPNYAHKLHNSQGKKELKKEMSNKS